MKKLIFLLLLIPVTVFSNQPTSTSQFEEILISYPEYIVIDKKVYRTEGTWVIGRELFAVKIIVREKPSKDLIPKAKIFAEHFYKNGFLQNGRKLNRLYPSFHIGDFVGIALIYGNQFGPIPNKEGKRVGYRHSFPVKELNVKEVKEIKLPDSFNESEIKDLEKKLETYYRKMDFRAIYELMSERARKQVNYMNSYEKTKSLINYIKDIKSVKYFDSLYMGTKGPTKGFRAFFKTDYISKIDDSLKSAYIIVTVIDYKPKYEIYGVQFNIN